MTFECEWNWRFRSYIFASKCPKILWKRLIIIIWTWKHGQIHFILTMASDIVTSAPSQLHKIYTKILHPRKLNNIQVTQANTNIGKRQKKNKQKYYMLYLHSFSGMNELTYRCCVQNGYTTKTLWLYSHQRTVRKTFVLWLHTKSIMEECLFVQININRTKNFYSPIYCVVPAIIRRT